MTPSVISMALLANRIGVNKLELFLRDLDCAQSARCSSGCDGRRARLTVARPGCSWSKGIALIS